MEVIHQWQFIGQTDPKLLEDEAFERAKQAGITSLETFFLWKNIEKEEGKIDWSCYDVLVEKIKKHGLKWVPFLILGPAYANPEWFQKSSDSVFYRCLEHQQDTGNQSIWSPKLRKYVERFLSLVSERYSNQGVLESVILGVAGNWGEAIYPAGGYWFGNFHTHDGFWAGDPYARESFINFSVQKYKTLQDLNRAWGTNFSAIQKIEYPLVKESQKRVLVNLAMILAKKCPDSLKKILKSVLAKATKKSFLFASEPNSQPELKSEEKQRWLDFTTWYLDSMSNWVDFWVKTARRYFPETKLYLVTGGTGRPVLGADFARQAKIASQYGAGIRITNQTNSYAQSFILTRLVATAAKFYKSFFTTEEEAVLQTPEGVTMRLFDVMSSGARGFYCRNIISQGKMAPFVIPEKIPVGQATPAVENMKKYLPLFDGEIPEISSAVFFPNTSLAFDSSLVISLYNRCAQLRDKLDFDLVDETLIKEGALSRYKHLLVLEGEIPSGEVKSKVEEWQRQGGVLALDPKTIPSQGIDDEADGVYASKFANRALYYNSNNKRVKKSIPFLQKSIEMEPNSIVSISFQK
ncbi:MAG: beta-galactosidase [Candidatus Nealsonbacteria bacterium]|nr:beta-galactosidase [Candidatus Nealsonbacteria bacterium]